MTIEEAFQSGVYKLRRDPWGRGEYMELHVEPSGQFYGPLATLYSILNSEDVPEDIRIPPQDIPLWQMPDDGWEEHVD